MDRARTKGPRWQPHLSRRSRRPSTSGLASIGRWRTQTRPKLSKIAMLYHDYYLQQCCRASQTRSKCYLICFASSFALLLFGRRRPGSAFLAKQECATQCARNSLCTNGAEHCPNVHSDSKCCYTISEMWIDPTSDTHNTLTYCTRGAVGELCMCALLTRSFLLHNSVSSKCMHANDRRERTANAQQKYHSWWCGSPGVNKGADNVSCRA